jgi:predicted dehydrogenase
MPKQGPIRFGNLGAAKIAPNALTLPAKQVPEVEVNSIAARDPARAREFAKANGIARVLVTCEDLVADSEIDVVYNPLPN